MLLARLLALSELGCVNTVSGVSCLVDVSSPSGPSGLGLSGLAAVSMQLQSRCSCVSCVSVLSVIVGSVSCVIGLSCFSGFICRLILVVELLCCFGSSNSIAALAAAASAREIQLSGNQLNLCLGLFCRYMAFAIIFKGNRSHFIRRQIWGKLAMCQVTS